MFARLQLELDIDSKERVEAPKAAILQSVMMQRLDKEYADKLHESGLHSYTQALLKQDNRYVWEINTFNKEAYINILQSLNDENFDSFYIEHDKRTVKIVSKKMECMSKDNFMERYYFGENDRYFTIQFRTPTAFKQQGQYVFYPDLMLIFNSLMSKYDAAFEDETIKSEELLEEVIQYSSVVRYQLRSTYYNIGAVRIPSFVGKITIKVSGPQAMVNLANLLFRFGEYSGIGIKTGMGMGNIQLMER